MEYSLLCDAIYMSDPTSTIHQNLFGWSINPSGYGESGFYSEYNNRISSIYWYFAT